MASFKKPNVPGTPPVTPSPKTGSPISYGPNISRTDRSESSPRKSRFYEHLNDANPANSFREPNTYRYTLGRESPVPRPATGYHETLLTASGRDRDSETTQTETEGGKTKVQRSRDSDTKWDTTRRIISQSLVSPLQSSRRPLAHQTQPSAHDDTTPGPSRRNGFDHPREPTAPNPYTMSYPAPSSYGPFETDTPAPPTLFRRYTRPPGIPTQGSYNGPYSTTRSLGPLADDVAPRPDEGLLHRLDRASPKVAGHKENDKGKPLSRNPLRRAWRKMKRMKLAVRLCAKKKEAPKTEDKGKGKATAIFDADAESVAENVAKQRRQRRQTVREGEEREGIEMIDMSGIRSSTATDAKPVECDGRSLKRKRESDGDAILPVTRQGAGRDGGRNVGGESSARTKAAGNPGLD